jgi:hypothetical protein
LKKRNKSFVFLLIVLCVGIIGVIYHKVTADEKLKELKIEKTIPKPNKIPKKSEELKTLK